MAKTLSRWRAIARRDIRVVLDGIPVGTPEAAVRKALQDAYPFGEREMHPYKCWLLEQRIALEERFGRPAKAGSTGVRYVLTLRGCCPWLAVRCGLCDDRIAGGCLQCVQHVAWVIDIVTSPEWRAFQRAGKDAFGMAADWLKDRGAEVEVMP